jgi:hypothetical protein
MKRRAVLNFIPACVLGPAASAAAPGANIVDAVNKAGRQRTLSQRMTKAYLALCMDVSREKAAAVLGESVATFERNIVELRGFAPRDDIKWSFRDLDAAWHPCKMLLAQPPQRERIAQLLELEDKILQLATQGANQIEQLSGKPMVRMVSLTARQRMLSQRTAKLFFALAGKLSLPGLEEQLAGVRAEFKEALAQLESEPHATVAVRRQLDMVRQQWTFLDLAPDRQPATHRALENAFAASENVLGLMEVMTATLARQLA